jgi:hypothetical protein
MRTADLPQPLVCRTVSGSTYTVRPDGSVNGPYRGTLVTAGHPRPSVGGRLLIDTAGGLVVTSELVRVDVAPTASTS